MTLSRAFTSFANGVAKVSGRSTAFIACLLFVAVWAATGPLFRFSDSWQLVINTSTTIITFLMVFLIQNTQNRDSMALHAKLDALIECGKASNRFIGIEDLTDQELEAIVAEQNKHQPTDSLRPGAEPDPPKARRTPAAGKPEAAAA